MADALTESAGTIGIVVFQIPNCPVVFPSDPKKKGRGEEQEAKNDFEANWPKAPERYPSSAPPAGEPCSRSGVQAV